MATKYNTPKSGRSGIMCPGVLLHRKRRAFWSLNEDILKITILKTNTPYPSRKIQRIRACTHQRPQRNKDQYVVSRGLNTPYSRYQAWSLLQEIPNTPYPTLGYAVVHDKEFYEQTIYTLQEPERKFRSSRRHFKTLSIDELRSPDFNLLSDQEYSEEEEAEAMAETTEQYMSKTRTDYGSGVARTKIDNKDQFELKGQFLKELQENPFSGLDNEDANEHIEKVLEIVDLFHVSNITVDQLMLRVFPISLIGAASRWLRNELTGSIETLEDLKTKFLNKYIPPSRTAKKMKEINNFQQESDETIFQAWERFKELLMKCPQHYLTEIGRSTENSDGLAAIQAQLNNLGREIKKRQSMEDTMSKFMSESAKRHEENSNLIKEIRATTDAAIRNQGASIKTLEIQIGQWSKVLQERGFGSLPSSTETNPRDQVNSISTTIEADSYSIRRIGSSQYATSTG
ncbi:hypothetical protein Tco_1361912 [Tanacetum coccineum]